MDDKRVINLRQLGWLTGSVLTGGGLISVQNVLVRVARTDTWLVYLLPTLYVFAIIAVLTYLARLFPQKHLYDIIFVLFGKIGGSIVNGAIVVHLWLILVRDISSFNRFFNTMLLPMTPLEMITIIIVSLFIYFGRTGVEVVARVNDVFFPLFILLIVVMPAALLNEMRPKLLQPVMATSFSHYLSGSVIATGWFGDLFFLGAFLHMLHSHTHIKTAFRRGAVVSMFILSLILGMETAVFGPFLPGNFIYPSYNLVQQIHITDFLDRVDIIVLMIWFPVTSCKMFLLYHAMLTGLSCFMKKPDPAVLNKPTGMLLVITSLSAFRSTTEVFSFGNYPSAALIFGYQPLLCLLLVLLAKRYEKRHGLEQFQQQNLGREKSHSLRQSQSFWTRVSSRYSTSVWTKATNGTMACMLLVVLVGYGFGKRLPLVSDVCGILYALGLVMLMLSTFAEAKTALAQKQ
jgi:spore germination protein (amino acid permease)